MIGKQISTDVINHWIAYLFTPWVSQIYLTMAAFNLARRDQTAFKEDLSSKFKIYGLILIYFIFENFLVAPNLGQAISFYPIMLWMLILGLISLVNKYLGFKGVVALSLIALFRFVIPVELISDLFEEVIQNNIHPGFEYDARIEYFILSGCLGFIMGHVHYHFARYKHNKDLLFMGFGILLIMIYFLIGDPFIIYDNDFFRTEHDLARTFSGTAYIIGIQALVISGFLWLEKKSVKINLPVINWIGIYSLMIFALHRIFFVKIIAPVSVLLGSLIGRTLSAATWEIYLYIIITLGMCYFVSKSSIFEVILQKKSKGH